MQAEPQNQNGFSLVELLIVIVILGLLATAVVFAVGGITADAQDSGCDADAHILITATEAFFAQKQTDEIWATGGTNDKYEITLVNQQFLRHPSDFYDLNDTGGLVAVAGSSCTVT
jgi:prepilin-type N-terminal cleavage/methylation domain-containing protein